MIAQEQDTHVLEWSMLFRGHLPAYPSGILLFGNKHTAMPGTKKYTVPLTLDQVVDLLEQLSEKDKLKVVKRLERKPRTEAVHQLIAVLSKM